MNKQAVRPRKSPWPGSISVVAPPEAAPVNARLNIWHAVPGLSTGVASEEGDNLEISVSAEVYQEGGSVFFRALVDGLVALPSDVEFKNGATKFDGIRSFTFIKENVGAGQHIVEVQWQTGTPAQVRDRVLTVHSAAPSKGPNRLAVAAGVSGPVLQNSSSTYRDIPGLSVSLSAPGETSLAVVFSAETFVNSGQLMIRALMDGTQLGEVLFCEGGDSSRQGTRSFTFAGAMPGGTHLIKLQWKAVGGTSQMGDRTVAASAGSLHSQDLFSRGSDLSQVLEPGDWTPMPVFAAINALDSVTTLAITFSAEVKSDNGRIFLRALVDGQPASPADVTLIEGGSKWRATGHTFIVKNLTKGRHTVVIEAKVDPATSAEVGRCCLRTLWMRRSGSDFAQPYLGMTPRVRTYKMLVIGFDPMRPGQTRPTFAQIKSVFEGDAGPIIEKSRSKQRISAFDKGPNVRDWLAENSGKLVTLGQVRYVGCLDSGWYVAPPDRQGTWYWDNAAFDQMWKDALAAADADVDFHAYDSDHDNTLEIDELLVAIVRPQNDPYGTHRGTSAVLDGDPAPLSMPLLDLYLSSNSADRLWGVGLVCHELSHGIFGTLDLYGNCPTISPGYYSIMDQHYKDTHLDPFEKMKNGLVQPRAIDLTTQETSTFSLPAVETARQILLLYDAEHVAKEYFLVENRFPGKPLHKNYDGPLGMGAVAVWQIFEDPMLVQNSAVCTADPRFIRLRAVLQDPAQSFDLAWADGSSAGFRVSAPVPNNEHAEVTLEKL